jgi:hypothetical protein
LCRRQEQPVDTLEQHAAEEGQQEDQDEQQTEQVVQEEE